MNEVKSNLPQHLMEILLKGAAYFVPYKERYFYMTESQNLCVVVKVEDVRTGVTFPLSAAYLLFVTSRAEEHTLHLSWLS